MVGNVVVTLDSSVKNIKLGLSLQFFGRCTDNGDPIAATGGNIEFYPSRAGLANFTTDANGWFRVNWTPREVHVGTFQVRAKIAYYAGYFSAPITLTVWSEEEPITYEFRVTADGAPVNNAACALNSASDFTGAEISGYTGYDGVLRLVPDFTPRVWAVVHKDHISQSGVVTGTVISVQLGPVPDPDVFVCPHCGAEFLTKAELDAHIASEHPGKPPPVGWLNRVNYYIAMVPAVGFLAALFAYDLAQKLRKDVE